jgi:hypothetical protein
MYLVDFKGKIILFYYEKKKLTSAQEVKFFVFEF